MGKFLNLFSKGEMEGETRFAFQKKYLVRQIMLDFIGFFRDIVQKIKKS
jgi:hypothetical protein